jgi:hypothetical protein
MAKIAEHVGPGDLIKSSLINLILDKFSDLDDRVTLLQISGSGSVQPAIGYVDLKYKSSTRGVNLVPGDPTPYPHTFTAFNNTNQTLVIQISGVVTSPHGTWGGTVQGTTVQLPSGGSQDVTISVTPPSDAQIGDDATLTASAVVGPPSNLQQQSKLPLHITATTGPAVTQSVQFTQTVLPNVNTDDVDVSTAANPVILPYAFSVRYSTSTTPLTANFKCTLTATAAAGSNVDDWAFDFLGLLTTKVSSGVFTSAEFQLNANTATDLVVTARVRTPLTRDATTDKLIGFTVKIDSTTLQTPISVQTVSFPLRLRHS